MLVAREVNASPDPVGMARRLAASGHRRIALLHAAETGVAFGRWSYVAADPDGESERLDPLEDDEGFDGGGESALASVPRWIGVVPYEHRRDLERAGWAPIDTRPPATLRAPRWLRYPAVIAVDHDEGRVLVVGTEARAVARMVEALRGPAPAPGEELSLSVHEDEPGALHEARIVRAKELIVAGDLYQVNLARRLSVALHRGHPLDLHAALARRAPTPFGAYLELDDERRVISTSPELLLHAESAGPSRGFGQLLSAPIKGSRPRGRDADEDRARIAELDGDPKENAELAMIIDVVRNDLGRVAAVGSVRLIQPPHVVTHRTIHHRLALLSARARPGVGRSEVLRALVPSGSVTGAPKVRAMEVIASLEPRRRGLYTGGLGFVAQSGSVTLSMAIRTVVLVGREGEYFTGGGIVVDSDPAREVEETRWKALQLEGAARAGTTP